MQYPTIPTAKLIERLEPPKGRIRGILDTDTYNEVDDQFALAHMILSPDVFELEAVYAAPFHNDRSDGPGDGMEKSFQEIHRVMDLMGYKKKDRVFRGSTTYLPGKEEAVDSPAARDLIKKALDTDPAEPLYVFTIGAVTNVASAILLEPSIIERIVVVFLGGHVDTYPHVNEFNLKQDIPGSQVLFDCGVPLIHIPACPVASHLLTTVAELEYYLRGKNALCDYLVDIVGGYRRPDDMKTAWSKVIWDISATAWPIVPKAYASEIVHSPILTDQLTWSRDRSRHFIRQVFTLSRDPIFTDVFKKLAAHQDS